MLGSVRTVFQQVHITRFSHAVALLKVLQYEDAAMQLAARKVPRFTICGACCCQDRAQHAGCQRCCPGAASG